MESQSAGETQLVLQNTGFTIVQRTGRKYRQELDMKIKNLLKKLLKISKRYKYNVKRKTTLAKKKLVGK